MRLNNALVPVVPLLAMSLAGCLVADTDEPLPDLGPAADFDDGTAWLNSPPLDLAALEGKVVLVDFWTYSCINCIRTLPHVTAWFDTYEDDGLVVIGVHSPEFDFEKDPDNVLDAMDRYRIHYPVVQDNDFDIWREYENRFWPAKYLIDADGDLRYKHFGEGAYARTEGHIRTLLLEAGVTDLPPVFEGSQKQADRGSDITPELYAGTWRQADAVGNPEGYRPGEDVSYTMPDSTRRDRIYLEGTWHNGEEALTAVDGGRVHLSFNAGGANFVADGPDGTCIPVSLDGPPITDDLAGPDVMTDRDVPCILLAQTPRSYDFYAGPVQTHTVTFDVPAGFELYTFAFSAYPEGGSPA